MKEELEFRETDSRVLFLGQRKVGMILRSRTCLSMEKGVLGTDNIVELCRAQSESVISIPACAIIYLGARYPRPILCRCGVLHTYMNNLLCHVLSNHSTQHNTYPKVAYNQGGNKSC